jgi:hypothetical protein
MSEFGTTGYLKSTGVDWLKAASAMHKIKIGARTDVK